MSSQDRNLKWVTEYIEHADDFEIQEIMEAVRRRYAMVYPQWGVFYTAVHKEPALRRKELYELVAYVEKDLNWNTQQKRTPSD